MQAKCLPSREVVRQLLTYDPNIGMLTWLPRKRWQFRSNPAFVMWNIRYAGGFAGTAKVPTGNVIAIDDHQYRTHRIIWLLVHGDPVPDVIDHIDGDPFNNRISNLRAATDPQNKWNTALSRNNTSGFKGVTFNKLKGQFQATVRCNGRRYWAGYFATAEEAAIGRRELAMRLHGDFVRHG